MYIIATYSTCMYFLPNTCINCNKVPTAWKVKGVYKYWIANSKILSWYLWFCCSCLSFKWLLPTRINLANHNICKNQKYVSPALQSSNPIQWIDTPGSGHKPYTNSFIKIKLYCPHCKLSRHIVWTLLKLSCQYAMMTETCLIVMYRSYRW